jgi:palmitoyltransferase
MAPMLSKPERPPPGTPAEVVELATRKARPLLELVSQVLQSGLRSTGEAAAQLLGGVTPLVEQCARASVRLLEGLCCFDFRKYVSGPNPPKLMDSLAPLLVLLLISLLYNAFVLVYMPAAGIALASHTSMIFHAFIFLALSSFAKAAQTDPGGVPNSKEWRTYGQPPPHLRERKHGKDQPRWCRKSDAYKPDRAHYSTAMRRVVLKFDHHCPWLGNTMGHGNYKFFFLFLLYASSACVMFNMNIIQLLVHLTLPAVDTFLLLGAEVLTVILTSILVPFTLFHAHLISRNMTTCEYWCRPEDSTVLDCTSDTIA